MSISHRIEPRLRPDEERRLADLKRGLDRRIIRENLRRSIEERLRLNSELVEFGRLLRRPRNR